MTEMEKMNTVIETAISNWFIDAVRARRIKGWGWFESCQDGKLHLIRHEHPNVWMWIVDEPSSAMPGFTRVIPYKFDH